MEINNKLLITIIIALFILYLLCDYKSEKEKFTSKYVANDHIYTGHRRDGNDLLDDSLFNKVITYENDDDPYACGGRLGIDKCLDDCDGRCIEFGVTGIGYCFPKE
jgi:hypothetical protein